MDKSNAVKTLLIGAAAGIIGCQFTKPASVMVPLQYATTTDANSGSFTVPNHPVKLYVAPLIDNRPDKGPMGDKIGENEEDAGKMIPVMASPSTVPQYVHDAVVSQLRSDGITVVDSASGADRVLNLTLVKFWAVEDPNYHAMVQMNGTLTDKSGASAMWTGGAAGDDSTFGRSLNAANYNQVLSNAVSKATGNLLRQPQFFQSLSTQ